MSLSTPLAGKKIIWSGTSIPKEDGTNSYPNQIGLALGANLINKAYASSHITWWSGSDEKSLSAKKSELHLKSPGDEYYSYESIFIGSNADLIVIDHMYNDRARAVSDYGGINSNDRSTFLGAFNYVIEAIYNDNHDVRIVLCTCPNNIYEDATQSKALTAARKGIFEISNRWGLPVIDFQKTIGYNEKTRKYFTYDGTHPTSATVHRMAIKGYRDLLAIG